MSTNTFLAAAVVAVVLYYGRAPARLPCSGLASCFASGGSVLRCAPLCWAWVLTGGWGAGGREKSSGGEGAAALTRTNLHMHTLTGP